MMLAQNEPNKQHTYAPCHNFSQHRSAPIFGRGNINAKRHVIKFNNQIPNRSLEDDEIESKVGAHIAPVDASIHTTKKNTVSKVKINKENDDQKTLSDMISFLQNKLNFPQGRELNAISKEFNERFITPYLLENWILKECRLKLMWDKVNPKNEISYGLVEFFNQNYYNYKRKNDLGNLECKIRKIKEFHLDKTKVALKNPGELSLEDVLNIQDQIMSNIVSCKEWRVYCEHKYDNDLELLRARLLQLYNTFDSIRNQKIKDEDSQSNLYN